MLLNYVFIQHEAGLFECFFPFFFFDQPDQTVAIKMYERAGWRAEKRKMNGWKRWGDREV